MSLSLSASLAALPSPLRALVIGGTGGIGLAIAQHLSTLPSSETIISGRNPPANVDLPSNIKFKALDASSLAGTKTFCSEVATSLKPTEKLNLLVLSPGILSMQGRTPTPEGVDIKMCLHYYARMLIIRELLASSSLSPKAIIISVLDGASGDPSGNSFNWTDMDLALSGAFSVSACKTACVGYTDVMIQDFSQAHPGMTFVHSFPGLVQTDLFKNARFPFYVKWALPLLTAIFAVTPAFSAEKILAGSVEGWQAEKGTMFLDGKGRKVEKLESPEDVKTKVREHTWALVDKSSAP